MKKRISAMYCIGAALLSVSPATFAFSVSTLLPAGLEPSSAILLCGGLAGVFAIRRIER